MLLKNCCFRTRHTHTRPQRRKKLKNIPPRQVERRVVFKFSILSSRSFGSDYNTSMIGGVSTHAVHIYLPIVNGRDNTRKTNNTTNTEIKETSEFRASEKARRGIKATLLNSFGTSVFHSFFSLLFVAFNSLQFMRGQSSPTHSHINASYTSLSHYLVRFFIWVCFGCL